MVSPVADVVRRCISQFSWAAGVLPPPPAVAMAANSSVMIDEVDAAGEVSMYDHMQQPQETFTGLQDHVISFHQSQSDPINRGLLTLSCNTVYTHVGIHIHTKYS